MGKVIGFGGILIAMGIALFLYSHEVKNSVAPTNNSPTTTINATGVRTDLMQIAQAEKDHHATDGTYVSLDELRTANPNLPKGRPDFTYSVELTDAGFNGIATYTGNEAHALHTITINQDMKVTGQN